MRKSPLRRPALLATLAAFLLLGLNGCAERIYSMNAERVGSETFLVVEVSPFATGGETDEHIYGIYRATNPQFSDWQLIAGDLQGPVFGTFVWKDKDAKEYLGVIHTGSVSLMPADAKTGDSTNHAMSMGWQPETGAQIGNELFLFGGKFPDDPPDFKGNLHVGRFNGEKFEDVTPSDGGPGVESGRHGFWVKSVAHNGKIHVFWRGIRATESLGFDMEPPYVFTGALRHFVFDGKTFMEQIQLRDALPDGFLTAWSEGGKLHLAVQPQDESHNTPTPHLFTLTEEGALEEETPSGSSAEAPFEFKQFMLERLPGGPESFARTNGQRIEIWSTGGGAWSRVGRPSGLPELHLERSLFTALGILVAFVAAGIGFSMRRNRQIAQRTESLEARDALAPLFFRVSAYLIDMVVVIALTTAAAKLGQLPSPAWFVILVGMQINPVFLGVYLAYFVACEWLFGATAGKYALSLRVVSDRGGALSPWSAFVRNFTGFFERFPMLAPIAAIPPMLITPRGQRLGDLMGRSVVVQRLAFARLLAQRAKANLEAAVKAAETPATPPAPGSDSESQNPPTPPANPPSTP